MKIPEDKAQAHQTRQEKETIREVLYITTWVMKRKVSRLIYLYVIWEYLFRKRLTRIKQR